MQLFPFDHKSPWWFNKNNIMKTNKFGDRISIMDLPGKPAKQKKRVAIEN